MPVLSWPSDANRGPRPPKETWAQLPPSAGRTPAPPCTEQSPERDRPTPRSLGARAHFRQQPSWPDPQSQTLSRSYGSNLPTSLTYIVLGTRGCSPWRPAADMGTDRGRDTLLPGIFKGQRKRTGRRGKRGALQEPSPYLRPNRFQGFRPLQRRENSSRGSRQRLPVRWRCRSGPAEAGRSLPPGSGILTRFPFREGPGGLLILIPGVPCGTVLSFRAD